MLAAWCRDAGLDAGLADPVSRANTSRHALDLIRPAPAFPEILKAVMRRAAIAARVFLGPEPALTYYLFDFDECLLGMHREAGGPL